LTQDVINYLVYPNPVTDYLYIKCSDAVTSVDVLDISGKVILSEKVIGSTSEINTSSLKVGIYHVRFMQDNGEFLYFKIIKSVL
jgi:hypothetical protein